MYKIGLDLTPLKTGHASRGVGKYTNELIGAIKALKLSDIEIIPSGNGIPLNNCSLDLYHYPYFDLFFPTLPWKKETPTVVTVHDVTPLVFPENYPPGIRGTINFWLQKFSLGKVEAVITDSLNSKKDIVKYLKYPEEKINVIYLAPSLVLKAVQPVFLNQVKKKYKLPGKFVLYVGDVNWNKNVVGLADICHKINIPLVIVGKNAKLTDFDKNHIENQPLVKLLEKYQDDPSVLRLGFIENDELEAIYKLASVYCQPSFYEGFGLPILDAMLLGCPVVCSNSSSLPEIGQDAVKYFDPRDEREFKESLENVLSNSKKAKELIDKGFLQVKNFSWKKTAKETVSVYKKVLENTL